MMRKDLFDFIGLSLLAIFLFSTHAKLFYWLQPEFHNEIMQEFSWLKFNEKTLQAEISGLLFGLITVYIFARKNNSGIFKVFVIVVAFLDGIAVFYLNEGDILPYYKMFFASIHYAIYVIFIILMFGFGKNKDDGISRISEKKERISRISNFTNDEISLKISEMIRNKIPGNEISRVMNISEATVSRIKKQIENGRIK